MRCSAAAPRSCFRSSTMLRLLRFRCRKIALMPRCLHGPTPRVVSPSRDSILHTSAPMSASRSDAYGPMKFDVRSRMRTPSSGPAMTSPPACSLSAGQDEDRHLLRAAFYDAHRHALADAHGVRFGIDLREQIVAFVHLDEAD